MALAFNKIKTKLNLYDKLTFGKFKDCRVCDILVDHIEYLEYLKHEKIAVFDDSILEAMQDIYNSIGAVVVKEEVYKDSYDQINGYIDNWEDDVPF